MKSERRWRYKCDFCGKWGGSKHHMEKHERGCTLNPRRQCGVCYYNLEGRSAPLPDLLWICHAARKVSPVWISLEFRDCGYYDRPHPYPDMRPEWFDVLREEANGCPVCILAAMRQAKTGAESFKFKEELEAFWNAANDPGENYY